MLHLGTVFLKNLFSSSVGRVGSAKSTIGFIIGLVEGSIAISSNCFYGFCYVFGFVVKLYCLVLFKQLRTFSAWLVTRSTTEFYVGHFASMLYFFCCTFQLNDKHN